MSFEHYITNDGKKLRLGFTTGTCAALAAAGAAEGLLTGCIPDELRILTPKGIEVCIRPRKCRAERFHFAACGVVKDAGDDKDATNGLLIMARAEIDEETDAFAEGPDLTAAQRDLKIRIAAGEGVGIVTKPGLDQMVGEAAINRVPRQMIRQEVLRVCEEQGFRGSIKITISVPGGREAAEHTLNSRLGIMGGISIIGTSGIVEPMSMQAYSDSVRVQIRQEAALHKDGAGGRKNLILTPGNYGLDYLRAHGYDLMDVPVVVCSNFIGDAVDEAQSCGFSDLLLIGHVGKLVKLAAGIMNTHSSIADGRREIFTAHAALAGASSQVCAALMETATTDACIEILREESLDRKVLKTILQSAQLNLSRRAAGMRAGMILFSNVYGELGRTEEAEQILASWLK